MNRFAVIATAGNRECLRAAILAIRPQVDRILVVLSGNDPVTVDSLMRMLPEDEIEKTLVGWAIPFNLSQSWNVGLRWAQDEAEEGEEREWFTAVLNDDAIVSPGWFDAVTQAMTYRGAAAGSSESPTGHIIHQLKAGPVPVHERMRGWAFILRGSTGLRADETFAWWFGDDDLAWRAMDMSGVVMIPGHPVENLYPNGSFTPELQVRAAKDAAAFEEKWGQRPW